MPFQPFWIYLLAAIALVVHILSVAITDRKEERQQEWWALRISVANAPLVLQGVWLTMIAVWLVFGFPFNYFQLAEKGPLAAYGGTLKTLLAAGLLMALNAWLLHKANTTERPAQTGWQLLHFLVGCALLTNLALNYFYHDGNGPAPWVDYTSPLVLGILCVASLLFCLPLLRKKAGPPTIALYMGWAWSLLMAVLLVGLLLAGLWWAAKHALGWLFDLPFWEPLFNVAIRLAPVGIMALLNVRLLRKAIRTKHWLVMVTAAIFCWIPWCVCAYYCLTLATNGFFAVMLSFIIHLLCLLALAIMLAFVQPPPVNRSIT
jgi:hypothetical protein